MEPRSKTFNSAQFERWMAKNEDKLGERYGQNPDIIIKHNYKDGTVTITELPSENRKASMIEDIMEEQE